MHGLASFVMRGRSQAALVAAVAAVLSLLLPPILIIGGAAVALVTLRRGGGEGLLAIVLAGLGTAVLAYPVFATLTPAVGILLLFWLPLWLLAVILRGTVSLARTLQLSAVLGGLIVMGFYVVLDDPGGWWLGVLNEVFRPVLEEANLAIDETALNELMTTVAPLMPGLMAANLLISMLFGLLLGRWWQALLYNPGGFRDEFHQLRLGRQTAAIALGITGLALITAIPLFANLALVLGVIYALQGVSLVHGVIGKAGLAWGWLAGFYVLLIIALPQMIALLCLMGIADAWVDFRARIKPKAR